jgi:hypothetical protein
VDEYSALDLAPEEIERRLMELSRLYELGQALRDVRLIDASQPSEARETPVSGNQTRLETD